MESHSDLESGLRKRLVLDSGMVVTTTRKILFSKSVFSKQFLRCEGRNEDLEVGDTRDLRRAVRVAARRAVRPEGLRDVVLRSASDGPQRWAWSSAGCSTRLPGGTFHLSTL